MRLENISFFLLLFFLGALERISHMTMLNRRLWEYVHEIRDALESKLSAK